MGKGTWIALGIIVVTFIGLFSWSIMSNTKVDVSDIKSDRVLPASESNGDIADHYLGNKDAKIVVIEYGDYQCYGCSQLSPRLNTLMENYKDNVALVYRNFVIDGHQNSRFAIACAEAAGFQGKYWEMHDIIFKQQASWTDASIEQRLGIFTDLAKTIGLNVDQFKKDIESPRINKKIETDIALAKKEKIAGTPSLFVNGKLVSSDIWGTDSKFKEYLNAELKKLGLEVPKEK
ncbi:MAG: thioredoxin domain-containing protein [Candidatus Nomurabacteria bacterium]|jgi:protein-disulfide isomerase|nr:thioredoxin domain-containing protein [Candidatus Nomurabacteria bacterium]